MTPEIAKIISDQDFYLKKAKRDKLSNHWMKYKNLRNDVHRHIEKAKSDYYTNILQEGRGDSAKIWKAFNQVLRSKLTSTFSSLKIDDTTHTTAKSVADGFNKFFESVGNKLAECFLYHSESSGNIGTYNSTFTIAPITSEFVSKYIIQLNSNKATGLDKISARTPSLTKLFNLSIHGKIFNSLTSRRRPSSAELNVIFPKFFKDSRSPFHRKLSSWISNKLDLAIGEFLSSLVMFKNS